MPGERDLSEILDRLIKRVTVVPGMHKLWVRFPWGSVPTRVKHDVWQYPQYAYGVYSAADLARRLTLPGITVIEFGVAGGNGLIALERIAGSVGEHLGVDISVFGFDSGEGLPPPNDYRDLPHVWGRGFYQMNRAALEGKLTKAKLVLGDIEETLGSFVAPSPVGFIAFDLDYYSSTKSAFRVFELDHLPRMYCYFDDTVWPEIACHNEYVGELCAIREFNAAHVDAKLCPLSGLRTLRFRPAGWNDQMYAFHDFRHPLYCAHVFTEPKMDQMPLMSIR
jgi:hypothetical protein